MDKYNFDLNDYKKRIGIKRSIPISIIIIFIILLVGVAYYFRNTTSTNKFYFVEVSSFLNYSQASVLASEIQSKGGAGYIYYDGTYHVLVFYYAIKNDAKMVAENLSNSYAASRVYTLETKKFTNISNFTKEENSMIKDMINYNITTINSLYKAIISYDKEEISSSAFNVYLHDIASNYNSKLKEFNVYQNLQNYSKYLNKINDTFSSIISANEEGNSAKIKYHLIEIVISHSKFLSYIN